MRMHMHMHNRYMHIGATNSPFSDAALRSSEPARSVARFVVKALERSPRVRRDKSGALVALADLREARLLISRQSDYFSAKWRICLPVFGRQGRQGSADSCTTPTWLTERPGRRLRHAEPHYEGQGLPC